MAFDAFMYIPGEKQLQGETQDDIMAKESAFEIFNFSLGAVNHIDIGSVSKGGGAGKTSFSGLTITKKTDTASCGLFSKLCDGGHIDEAHVVLRRSGGGGGVSGGIFLQFDFKLVMVESINWAGEDGGDVCHESIDFQYGAMRVTYHTQDSKGKMSKSGDAMWSRVKNKADFSV